MKFLKQNQPTAQVSASGLLTCTIEATNVLIVLIPRHNGHRNQGMVNVESPVLFANSSGDMNSAVATSEKVEGTDVAVASSRGNVEILIYNKSTVYVIQAVETLLTRRLELAF